MAELKKKTFLYDVRNFGLRRALHERYEKACVMYMVAFMASGRSQSSNLHFRYCSFMEKMLRP